MNQHHPTRIKIPTDTHITHPVLLAAPGVQEAAAAVEDAQAAQAKLLAARKEAHQKWAANRRKNALKPGYDPGPEPNPGIDFDERAALAERLNKVTIRLEGVVDANAAGIVEDVRIREEELLVEARAALDTLSAAATELGRLGRVLQTLDDAAHRPTTRQPRVTVDDLLYLLRKHPDDAAVLDFGDGRTRWLTVGGRS